MKYTATLLAVRDMKKSKQFYHDVLGLEIVADFGANVTLTGGIALQTADTWAKFICRGNDEIIFQNNATELYFEEDQIDDFAAKLSTFPDLSYVHSMLEHPWGQRVVRFYDPDKHIIEVGENIKSVCRRFLDSGMTEEQAAVRMDVPPEFVKACRK